MADPWGLSEPPAVEEVGPLPPRLAELAAITGPVPLPEEEQFRWPEPEELPEVAQLMADGWSRLDGGGWRDCLPAVWPAGHRCWVRDRLPKVAVSGNDQGHWVVPRDVSDEDEDEEPEWEDARDAGLPPPPAGRIWMLRSPWSSLGFEVVQTLIDWRCRELGLDEEFGAARLLEATRELLTWDEATVWQWWTGPVSDAARAWRAQGRDGEQVAGLVSRGLGPAETAELSASPCSLTEAQAVAWVDAVDAEGHEVVSVVRQWRALGLAAELPDSPPDALCLVTPDEAARWFSAGFDLHDIGVLRGLPLDKAVAWRDAGFASRAVYQLLHADHTLTPDEAMAFDNAGIDAKDRIRWVEAGFDASTARAWVDRGVLPNEARVWRADGVAPDQADIQTGHRLPPGTEVGWTGYGSDPANRQYGVTDPAGTRGRIAHERHW